MTFHRDIENAIESRDLEKIAELLEYLSHKGNAHEALLGRGYLADAIDTEDVQIVQLLINAGIDVNEKDEDDWTPLMYAACTDQLDIVKLLIDAGADINAQTTQGETALFWAADQGKPNIYNYLASRTDDILRQEVEEHFSNQ